jgi:spermidine synthase
MLWRDTIAKNPQCWLAHNNLGTVLAQVGRMPEAIVQYEQALRIKPDYPKARNDLAWMLATRGPAENADAVRAVALAERACKLSGNWVATYLDTLAAAYAAAGRFDDAVGTAQKAVELARSGGQPGVAEKIEGRLRLYRAGHACHQPANATIPPAAH